MQLTVSEEVAAIRRGMVAKCAPRADSDETTPALFFLPPTAAVKPFEVFVEPFIPKSLLLIVVGGHVAQATAVQAALVGFEIAVLEDRPEFAHPSLFPPGTTTRCGAIAEELAAFPVDRDTFIVVVTRGHQQDSLALRACIHRPAGYIGMIGSSRKVPLVRRQFLEHGWATAQEFDRVYAPIELDLGAVTVPEIALRPERTPDFPRRRRIARPSADPCRRGRRMAK